MPFARCEFVVQDERGNIVPGAEITVQLEVTGAPLATLFSDRDGTTPLSNPFTIGSDGLVAFHAVGGAYRITATSGSFSAVWRYKGIGTAQETDAAGLGGGGGGGGAREVLTAARTYYVRTDGSDSNDGLANTSGGAFLTIQKAIDTAVALDLSVYAVTINVAAGTYTGAVRLKRYVGLGPISVIGDNTTPSNVVVSVTSADAFSGDDGAGNWTLSGFKTVTATTGFHVRPGAFNTITLGEWDFGAAPQFYSHVGCFTAGGSVKFTQDYSVSGGITDGRHVNANGPGAIVEYSAALTVTGASSLTFGIFAYADRQGSIITAAIPTFSGFSGISAQRFVVQNLAFIYTGNSGINFFPGSTPGSGTDPGTSPYGLYS